MFNVKAKFKVKSNLCTSIQNLINSRNCKFRNFSEQNVEDITDFKSSMSFNYGPFITFLIL